MRTQSKSRRRFLPRLVALEDRLAPATFTVTNNANSGAGTLREAVGFANALSGPDTIVFTPGLIFISLTTGELSISEALTIQGPGASSLSINGALSSRIFNTTAAPGGAAIAISGLTLAGGKVTGATGGGAIRSAGESLTLSDCIVSGNVSTVASGGGISAGGGTVVLIRCTFNGNQSGGNGGGVDITSGTVSLTDCTVSNNFATSRGGGLGIAASGVALLRSTISGNDAEFGGGLYFNGTAGAGDFTIRNCTFSDNLADTSGGAIQLENFSDDLSVQNSTITDNTCDSGVGGGIALLNSTGSFTLFSTIVSGNTATAATSEDLFSKNTVTASSCAIGTTAGVAFFKGNATTTSLLGQDFKLGALASNGGLTQTHLPAIDSPILNVGSNPASLLTDQRGAPFVRSFGAGVDIGAVEVQNAFVVTTTADSGSGSLREAIAAANVNPGSDFITFDASLFSAPQTIGLTSGELTVGSFMNINGTGAGLVTISGNNVSRVFLVSGAGATAASLSNMTIADGKFGGLRNSGEFVSLSDCVITGNSTSVSGGGVSSIGGTLVLARCVVAGNSAGNNGGGVDASGGAVVTLTDCTIANNTANGNGGGLGIGSSSLTVTGCTISGNSAGDAGGFYFAGTVGASGLTIRNSTISGNSAADEGGAVVLRGFSGNAFFRNSTVTANVAKFGGSIARLPTSTGTIFIESCIMSGNAAATHPELYTTGVVNTAASLFSTVSGITTFNADAATLALTGQNPLLGPLQNNGGPTFTHVPGVGSPVISKGINPATPVTTDQRGNGYPRQRGPAVDIGAVEAMVFAVTNTNDSGTGSLRQATLDANAAAGADTITFDATVFASPQTIKLTTGQLTITQSATIVGPGAALITVSGNNTSRVFSVNGAGVVVATLSGLTISQGKAATTGGGLDSAAENVTLMNCAISDNVATGSGGGVSSPGGGTLTLLNCTVTGNQSGVNGGGVDGNSGVIFTVRDSTVAGNTAAGGTGGGIGAQGTVLIERSTVSGNSANSGGGVSNYDDVTLINTTISGNTAKGSGGGIRIGGVLLVQNSTITVNSAGGNGGGIVRFTGGAAFGFDSSIVSGNTAAGVPDVSTAGAVNATTSLFGSSAGIATFNVDATTLALVGQAALLSPLQANGGPTMTHLPLSGSPALNTGANPIALTVDQRGLPRSAGVTDIGAVEEQSPPSGVTGLVINGNATQRSRLTSIQVNLAGPVNAAALAATTFLTRTAATGSGTVGTVVDTSSGLIVTPATGTVTSVTLTFANVVNAGVQSGSLSDGRWQLAIPGAGFTSTMNDPILRRLYGDVNNDGTVDGNDLAAFGADFGSSGVSPFDFNNDLTVDALDFGEFGNRFGLTL